MSRLLAFVDLLMKADLQSVCFVFENAAVGLGAESSLASAGTHYDSPEQEAVQALRKRLGPNGVHKGCLV